jgi:Transposase DDE domain group 1
MSKGLQTLEFSFEGDALTHFGGLFLIQRFCNQLRLRRRLQRILKSAPHWVDYRPEDLILTFLYVLIAGIQRVNKTEILQYDGLLLALIGLKKFPDQTTLRRFLQRLPPPAIREFVRLHDRLRTELFANPASRTQLEFHMDSVVLTLYGKQQGARKGYNPRKKGRRSYHPILCFEAHGQEFWHGSLRPGDAASNTGARFMVQRCLEKVPSHIARSRIRFLADAGYFSGKLVKDLDQAGCGYIIVASKVKNFLSLAHRAGFQPMHFGWGVAEFEYKPQKWQAAHRFIVVRRPVEDPDEADQPTLFQLGRFKYSAYITNLDLKAANIWRTYHSRANVEKSIRELLYHLALNKIPTQEWTANVAFFQLLLFAYNLVHWFKRLCLPEDYFTATVETIRNDFLVLPGKLTCRAGRNVLQLPRNYPHQKKFLEAARKIEKLRLAGRARAK